ncbi:MAG: uroporphyrinogen-III synthase, partial [Cyanobacteria bacterium P01_D01_bin.2]
EFLSPVVPSVSPDIAKALTRKIILTTRAAGQASSFTTLLSHQGATVIELPALEIRPPSSWAALDRALAHLSGFDWLVLTSANAVTFFLDRLLAQGYDLRQLASLKLAVVGKKTASVLASRGLKADFIPTSYVADALVEEFPVPLPGLRLLFPRVETGGRDVLVKEFTAQTATVTEVAAYESGCPQTMAAGAAAALQQGQVNAITFASSKTVHHFTQLMAAQFGEGWRTLLDGVAIASIGPQTTQACHEHLGRVDIEATTYTLEGLTAALVRWATHG